MLLQLIAIVRLGRLHFLVSGVLLHCLGVIVAVYVGASINWQFVLLGQLVITCTQLMTHYANEYFDLDADRANLTPTNWSGGSRVLVSGGVSPRIALMLARLFAGFALVTNLLLSLSHPQPISTFLLLITAQVLAWFYSAPPLRLHSSGVGEVTAAITVSGLTPIVGFFLQAGSLDQLIILTVIPLCLLQVAMFLAIEFPDAGGDRRAGKRTLVVRLGGKNAAYLYCGLIVSTFLLLPLLVIAGLPVIVMGTAYGLLPLTVLLLWRMWRGDWHHPQKWDALGFYSIALLVGMMVAQLAGFTLLIGLR